MRRPAGQAFDQESHRQLVAAGFSLRCGGLAMVRSGHGKNAA
jgi:hypothetical protein